MKEVFIGLIFVEVKQMISTIPYEEVLQIKLCRYPEFVPGATVSAYLVDGLLIDSGPAYTAEELTDFREQIFGEENPVAQRTQRQFSTENMVKSFLRPYLVNPG